MDPNLHEFRWPLAARPRITTAGCFLLNDQRFAYFYRGPTHAMHLHEYEGRMRTEDRELALAPGILTFSPAGNASTYDLPRPGQHWCVHFNPEAVGSEPTMSIPRHLNLAANHAEAAQRLARIAHLHQRSTSGIDSDRVYSAAATIALQDFLLWIALRDQAGDENAAPREPVRAVMEYINRRLHLSLRISDLAVVAGWSPDYLARRFREQTGQTIARFILHRRIEHARLLLLTTNLPVKQIGARVGMPDPQYFNKQMRRVLGQSPSALRS